MGRPHHHLDGDDDRFRPTVGARSPGRRPPCRGLAAEFGEAANDDAREAVFWAIHEAEEALIRAENRKLRGDD